MGNLTFEEGLKKLENIVDQLESGELDLEEAIKVFEEGINLSLLCQKELNRADSKIKRLLLNLEGEFELADLDIDIDDE